MEKKYWKSQGILSTWKSGNPARGYPILPFLGRRDPTMWPINNAFGVTSLWQHYLPAKVFEDDKDTSVKENKGLSI